MLLLIAAFVAIAEFTVLVPAISNFRETWLRDRIAAARTAALVFETAPIDAIPDSLKQEILESAGVRAIVLKLNDTRRLLATADMPQMVDEQYDLRTASLPQQVAATWRTLTAPPGRMLNIAGPAPLGGDSLEIVVPEAPLKEALLNYALWMLAVSVTVAVALTALVMAALHRMVLRPMRRFTQSIIGFGAAPEDSTRIIAPSGAAHELGRAEEALATMQRTLARELSEKKNLAALGLAVAKINHDLRNMLASAQLMSDRLAASADPVARRVVPKLIATLDRAISFCQATLAYGRAVEPAPQPRSMALRPLVEEVRDLVLPPGNPIVFEIDMAADFRLHADPDQLFRVLANLMRNAVEALATAGPTVAGTAPAVTVAAVREGNVARIDIWDNGPGIPAHQRTKLFRAFHGSTRQGGTGLGLAISADLMAAQGGSIELTESGVGTHFILRLPARGGEV